MKRTLLIIDFLNVAYRAFYSPIKAAVGPCTPQFPNGEPLSVTHNLISITHDLLAQTRASNVVFAFDAEGGNFREEIYPAYKAGRPGRPNELDIQLSRAREAIELLGYAIFEVPTFEADDVMATIVHQAETLRAGPDPAFEHIYVATGDHDLLAVVSERTTVLDLSRGHRQALQMTPDRIREQYGLEPTELIELKALTGDSSDNIPGVMGLNRRTGAELLSRYDSIAGLYKHLDELGDESLKAALIRDRHAVTLARRLITMSIDVPIELRPDSGLIGYLSRDSMANYLGRLGLGDLTRTLPRWHTGVN